MEAAWIVQSTHTTVAPTLLKSSSHAPDMIRRLAALAGIAVLLAVLVLLIWSVHSHRSATQTSISPKPFAERDTTLT